MPLQLGYPRGLRAPPPKNNNKRKGKRGKKKKKEKKRGVAKRANLVEEVNLQAYTD